MKKLSLILAVLTSMVLITSCASSKETVSDSEEYRKIDNETLRRAIESRRFIIKLERMYTYGGMLDLRPRSNYIIVDGARAVINAAYVGRQDDIRPIAGINMRGNATGYEITRRISREMYDIKLRVENGGAAFDVYLTISGDGTANASVNSMRISNARYRGYVVPLSEVHVPLQEENGVI
ncbi:MAG: DUF4251 domain-containing protein [Chloroflexota bacterium]